MKLSNETLWNTGLGNNPTVMGAEVYAFAERWANLMEEHGGFDPTTAKNLSHEADTNGINGWMYGKAVSVLAECWAEGDALRQWHNGDDLPGVKNPAVITIE